MKKVFIFWDNSNIFISGKTVEIEKEGQDAKYHLRLQFDNILELAIPD
ncbi:MAG: hypothetical protein HQK92_11575 [Nitrospirae bacterium]|nr:hypothetical protein [Nitrospirota bacterium]